jgi:hypothetical protein
MAADRVWLTCCALHNFLLGEDGLDDWNGELGLNDLEDLSLAPFALQRLSADDFMNFGSRQQEREATAVEANRQRWEGYRGDDLDAENAAQESDDHLVIGDFRYAADGSTIVNSLPYDDFRNRLVEHFDILHRQNRVLWPTRVAK